MRLPGSLVFGILGLGFVSLSCAVQPSRPNIVWLVSEDNSARYLRLYDPRGAETPHIDSLSREGIVFDHAFSNAPVCSVARSALITGCNPTKLGAQFHRRVSPVPMPEGLRMFPAYLRDAGYYTTNNDKEDYNFIKAADVWDESSSVATWRNRKPGQPFFHVQNFGTTHEGRLFFTRQQMLDEPTQSDPAEVSVPAYLPDTPLFRYSIARYLDLHRRVDEQIGALMAELEKDGLLDDTIIFYFADNGGVLPRSKGYIYESGVHVPLVARFPERWLHLAPRPLGSRESRFVSFIDFAPTVLALAGLHPPAGMDGQPFLGNSIDSPTTTARDAVYSYADRFDEKIDLVRAVRKGRYKYIRSFQPFNFDALFNQYRYQQLAYQELSALHATGELSEAQRRFFERRPPELLFDLDLDLDEMRNLASEPAFKEILVELRQDLTRHLKSLPDLSFYPESFLAIHATPNPADFGQTHRDAIARLIDIANLSLLPFEQARPGIGSALSSPDPWKRYWGLIVCSTFGTQASSFFERAESLAVSDSERLVRVRAAEFLGLTRHADPRPVLLGALGESFSAIESLLILNTITLLRDAPPGYPIDISSKHLGRAFGDLSNRLNDLSDR